MSDLEERVLQDDYPVYADYLYVADGAVVQSPIAGNVGQLKSALNVDEIKNCDIFGRMDKGQEL